jgi:5-formyltetrahydrofolate cyclo-ligase
MTDLATIKTAARKAAFAARKFAFDASRGAQSSYLSEVLAGYRGVPIAGYAPMRTEINPLPAMAESTAYGPVGMPVIKAAATPLDFREWSRSLAKGGGWATGAGFMIAR